MDPMNEELLVSLLEPTSWCEHLLTGKSGLPDGAPYRLRQEVYPDDSGIEATAFSATRRGR